MGGDIIPRVRISDSYFHVGHTIQLNRLNARIFYQHYGDSSLGYAGVPPGWNARGSLNPPFVYSNIKLRSIKVTYFLRAGLILKYTGMIILLDVLKLLVRKIMMELLFNV